MCRKRHRARAAPTRRRPAAPARSLTGCRVAEARTAPLPVFRYSLVTHSRRRGDVRRARLPCHDRPLGRRHDPRSNLSLGELTVHARLSRWLPLAVLGALGASTAAAQAPSPPQISVGALVYTQFVYQLKDSLNHLNNFDITRAYVNVFGRFSGGLYTRVTVDVYRNTAAPSNGSLSYRLKYAYAAYTPEKSPLTYKVGMIHTSWLDWEEALWDYRMQGTMAMERGFMTTTGTQQGYVSSSDFGVGVDGKWGPDKANLQVVVVNGENYNTS